MFISCYKFFLFPAWFGQWSKSWKIIAHSSRNHTFFLYLMPSGGGLNLQKFWQCAMSLLERISTLFLWICYVDISFLLDDVVCVSVKIVDFCIKMLAEVTELCLNWPLFVNKTSDVLTINIRTLHGKHPYFLQYSSDVCCFPSVECVKYPLFPILQYFATG